jgi:phage baseplate assembly protein W|tara:strand:+ start:134 stop:541 length:408 start_codon:yes stop_codon:yes gene_type:complete
MAIEFKKIMPIDLEPRKAVGLDLPFSGNAVFNSTFQTKDAIKANLINYFLTTPGERFFNVDFGAGLRELLFEQIDDDTLEEIKMKIQDDLKNFFPRVKPTSINLIGEPDKNTITFSMRYAIADSNINDTILINFE